MVKVGKWIAKHRILMLIIGFLLIIPSVIGMAATKVNYDLLSYLPEHLETVKGQDILVDEYGMGAFSMVVVENMEMKDVQKLEEKFEQVNHVKEVLWYDDVADISGGGFRGRHIRERRAADRAEFLRIIPGGRMAFLTHFHRENTSLEFILLIEYCIRPVRSMGKYCICGHTA